MALPISATPVLEGLDAEKFYKQMEKDSHKKISKQEINSILSIVQRNQKTLKLLCGQDA